MKSIDELNPHHYKTNDVIQKNLKILFDRLSLVQTKCGINLVISSGLRSNSQQSELIAQGKTKALHSRHLVGAAADVLDPHSDLAMWVIHNLKQVATFGLWMEDFAHTPSWVHFQIYPPKSGRRVFIP